jgi:hypothetical protein
MRSHMEIASRRGRTLEQKGSRAWVPLHHVEEVILDGMCIDQVPETKVIGKGVEWKIRRRQNGHRMYHITKWVMRSIADFKPRRNY